MGVNYNYGVLSQLGQGGIVEQMQQAEQAQRQSQLQQVQAQTALNQRDKLVQDVQDKQAEKQLKLLASVADLPPERRASVYQAIRPTAQKLNPANALPEQYDEGFVQFARNQAIGPDKLAELAVKRQTADATTDYRTQMLDLKQQTLDAGVARTQEAADAKRQLAAERGAQQYSADLDKNGLTDLLGAVNNTADRLQPYLRPGADVPGFGEGAGYVPDMLVSQEGRDLRQAYAGVRNSILKARSGGAVTESESKRLLQELGEGGGIPDAQVVTGMTNVSRFLQDRIANLQAGYSPEAIDTYTQRGGKVTKDAVKAVKAPPAASGWKIERID